MNERQNLYDAIVKDTNDKNQELEKKITDGRKLEKLNTSLTQSVVKREAGIKKAEFEKIK